MIVIPLTRRLELALYQAIFLLVPYFSSFRTIFLATY